MLIRYPSLLKTIISVTAILVAGSALAGPEHQQAVHTERSKKTVISPSTTPPCADKRPWYCGVSAEDQAHALELYSQANQLFDDALLTAAETKYRAALVYWKHPGIHYNLMLALVALEQPIGAYESSIEALRYGIKALKPEEYRRAIDYQKLLRGRIASLEVTCEEPDAVVTLNGKEILYGPGTSRLLVLPGKHELVARKEGYLTTHHSLVAVAQTPATVQMRLLPQEMALLPVRRWSTWKPWALVGAGVSMGLAGGLLERQADVNNRRFRALFNDNCKNINEGPPAGPGCLTSDYTLEMKESQSRYTWYRRIGHGASLGGSMAILSGLLLVYFNREYQIDNPQRQNLINVSAVPYFTPDAKGVALNLSF